MYTSGTVPYVPASPPSQYKRREKRAYYIQPVPRTRIGGSLRTRGPAPAHPPAQPTHTPTHTRGNKSLIPLSTFHFLYSTGIYLLPGTSMYTQYRSKKSKIRLDHTYYPTYLTPYLDHHYYRQYVRNLRNCRAETTYLVASLCIFIIIISDSH